MISALLFIGLNGYDDTAAVPRFADGEPYLFERQDSILSIFDQRVIL